jgi:hypothetical protein
VRCLVGSEMCIRDRVRGGIRKRAGTNLRRSPNTRSMPSLQEVIAAAVEALETITEEEMTRLTSEDPTMATKVRALLDERIAHLLRTIHTLGRHTSA